MDSESSVPSLALSAVAAAGINDHGRETYPHECCGALLGRDGSVSEILPLPNTTDEGPRRRFLIRPSDYRASEAAATSSGVELLGFYHSHPDHPARPSTYDLDHAWPNFAYVIVAVANAVPGDMTSWWLREDRSAFDEMPLQVMKEPVGS